MDMFTREQRAKLVANGRIAPTEALLDRPPVAELATPDGGGTWLISAIDPSDEDRAWGLCDPGLGSPVLGWTSLTELAGIRGRLGMRVRRDEGFRPNASLRAYADEAARVGVVIA